MTTFAKPFPQGYIDQFPTFDYTQFNISKNKKLFDQEASTLGLKPGKVPASIAINGKKSKVGFYLDHSLTHYENEDPSFFTFKPFQDYIEINPELKGWTVIIWND